MEVIYRAQHRKMVQSSHALPRLHTPSNLHMFTTRKLSKFHSFAEFSMSESSGFCKYGFCKYRYGSEMRCPNLATS